jgi:cytochrome c biogenesis protein CcdA
MLSTTLIFTVLSIALLDSINPSAIAMTFVILTNKKNQVLKSALYTLGIYLTNLTLGVIVFCGYKYFGSGFKPDFSFVTELFEKPPLWSLIAELIIGLILIVYTLKRGLKPSSENQKPKSPAETSIIGAFILGVAITGVEASTALPYLGAISTLYLNNASIMAGIGILLIYNIIFVLPPTLILLSYIIFRKQFATFIPRVNKAVGNFGAQLFFVGSILLGIFLVVDSILSFIGIKLY